MDEYSPGSVLPPHLSPFVEEQEGDYVPPERAAQLAEEEEEGESDVEEELSMETGELQETHFWIEFSCILCNGVDLVWFIPGYLS